MFIYIIYTKIINKKRVKYIHENGLNNNKKNIILDFELVLTGPKIQPN